MLDAVRCPDVPKAIRCYGYSFWISLCRKISTISWWLAPSWKPPINNFISFSPTSSESWITLIPTLFTCANSSSLLVFCLYSSGLSLRTLKSTWTNSMDLKRRCFWNFRCSSKRTLARQREFMPPERHTTTASLLVILILFCRLTLHLYSTFRREQALHIDSPLYKIEPGSVLHLKQSFVLGAPSIIAPAGLFTGGGSLQQCDWWCYSLVVLQGLSQELSQ